MLAMPCIFMSGSDTKWKYYPVFAHFLVQASTQNAQLFAGLAPCLAAALVPRPRPRKRVSPTARLTHRPRPSWWRRQKSRTARSTQRRRHRSWTPMTGRGRGPGAGAGHPSQGQDLGEFKVEITFQRWISKKRGPTFHTKFEQKLEVKWKNKSGENWSKWVS